MRFIVFEASIVDQTFYDANHLGVFPGRRDTEDIIDLFGRPVRDDVLESTIYGSVETCEKVQKPPLRFISPGCVCVLIAVLRVEVELE